VAQERVENNMIVYFNGCFQEKNEVRISPDDRGFLFADGLYEVIRAYQGRLFRLPEHLARLNYGAGHLHLATSDFGFLAEVAKDLLKKNDLADSDATVYFQVTRGAAKRGHAFPEPLPPLTIYGQANAFDASASREKMRSGIDVISLPDQRWARCDLKTVGLTANVLANQMAKEAGAQETIFVRDGVMIEGTHSNFMAVRDDAVFTAPESNYLLSGITRMAVLEICRELGIKTGFKPVFATDIGQFSEAMVVGTTVEVTPICRIDSNPVGSGTPGPIVRRLQKAFLEKVGGQ
jgi:D-alanine transaminase